MAKREPFDTFSRVGSKMAWVEPWGEGRKRQETKKNIQKLVLGTRRSQSQIEKNVTWKTGQYNITCKCTDYVPIWFIYIGTAFTSSYDRTSPYTREWAVGVGYRRFSQLQETWQAKAKALMEKRVCSGGKASALLGTNISPLQRVFLKMIFLFPGIYDVSLMEGRSV